MGFFSGIGKAIKSVGKVISIKNAINVVTGNGGAVVKDLGTRLKEGAQAFGSQAVKDVQGTVSNNLGGLKQVFPIPTKELVKLNASQQFDAVVKQDVLSPLENYFGDKINTKVNDIKEKIYQKPEVKGFMDYLKKESLKYYWYTYKKTIIVSVLGFAVLVTWLVMRKRTPKRGRK